MKCLINNMTVTVHVNKRREQLGIVMEEELMFRLNL